MKRLSRNRLFALIVAFVMAMAMAFSLAGCAIDTTKVAGSVSALDENAFDEKNENSQPEDEAADSVDRSKGAVLYDSSDFLSDIPEWSGDPFCDVNEGVPDFKEGEVWTSVRESLDPLDSLGRCGTANSCIGVEGMPKESRGDISEIHPTGWHTDEYDFVEGGKLFNRCHLIAHMLSGDDAVDRNLVTGTSYMNRQGMLPFEQAIYDYVTSTHNHVMYRVTPIFAEKELVCRGIHMEAVSVEDNGEGIAFNKFCYNVEPGVEIDYATGDNRLARDSGSTGSGEKAKTESELIADTNEQRQNEGMQEEPRADQQSADVRKYVLNTNTRKFHYPTCDSVSQMKDKNKQEVEDTREIIMASGYDPCGNCLP